MELLSILHSLNFLLLLFDFLSSLLAFLRTKLSRSLSSVNFCHFVETTFAFVVTAARSFRSFVAIVVGNYKKLSQLTIKIKLAMPSCNCSVLLLLPNKIMALITVVTITR